MSCRLVYLLRGTRRYKKLFLNHQMFITIWERYSKHHIELEREKLTSSFRFISFITNAGGKNGWIYNNIPNPLTDPEAAGRKGVKASRVCDPDHLLPKEQKDIIEGYINNVNHLKAEFMVVIIKKVCLNNINEVILLNLRNIPEVYMITGESVIQNYEMEY